MLRGQRGFSPVSVSTHQLLAVILAFAVVTVAHAKSDAKGVYKDAGGANEDPLLRDLISWLLDNDAFIDERLELRRLDPADPTSPRGIFASGGAFDEDETLFTIPWDLVVKPVDWPDMEDDDCGTIRAIHEAMTTKPTPYGRYLEAQPRRYLPGYWSSEGQALLRDMLGRRLPPRQELRDMAKVDWIDYCEGATADELEIHACMVVTARADDALMIPFYDMINHRNGKWYNTHHVVDEGKSFGLRTNRRVEKGDQLFGSYNQCNACGGRKDAFGTPEMFGAYGFVEPMPQRYFFEQVRLKFDIDEKDGTTCDDVGPGECQLEVEFAVPPSQRGLDFLRTELDRLRKFGEGKEEMKKDLPASVPQQEWDAVWSYHDALVVAFTHALDQAPDVSEEVWSMGPSWFKERKEQEDSEDSDDSEDEDGGDEEDELVEGEGEDEGGDEEDEDEDEDENIDENEEKLSTPEL